MRLLLLLQTACLLAACAPAPVAPPVTPAAPAAIGCQAARTADFEGQGEQQLRAYLAWLAQTHGKPVALKPSHMELAVVRSEPKPGPAGVQVGEVSCGANGYRITLYRDGLAGRPLAVAYETLAHEFFHVVQIRRDKLDCESSKGNRERYEREATDFARKRVRRCTK